MDRSSEKSCSPTRHLKKDPTELIAFLNHAAMGIMKVSSLILLERGEIVLYNVIDITVDLEVLCFFGCQNKVNCTDQRDEQK